MWPERAGVELRLDCGALSPSPLDHQMLAIARELISNAARHSGGSVVEVRVGTVDGLLKLEVADDGMGLAEGRRRDALREGHFGLVSVAERAEAVGGKLVVDSKPGEGTRVKVEAAARTLAPASSLA